MSAHQNWTISVFVAMKVDAPTLAWDEGPRAMPPFDRAAVAACLREGARRDVFLTALEECPIRMIIVVQLLVWSAEQ